MLYDCRTTADRDRGVAAAVEAVKSGELVVMPTDTVYGIGADAFTPHAITALHHARGVTDQVPPPVLVGSRHTLDGLVYSLPKAARELADAFWPGALTLYVEHTPSLQWDLGETGGNVAVRMPLHPVALEVLRKTGPMAVTSANKGGQPVPHTAEEAREQFGYAVSVYLSSPVEIEAPSSTIVELIGDTVKAVRIGGVSLDQLREVVPEIEAPEA